MLPLLLLAFASANLFAIQCGDIVSGNVTLTTDLVCTDQSGLEVGADNTTINLNGFSITCVGSGFAGSCQGVAGNDTAPLPVGINSQYRNNVTVQGPGVISGFGFGVIFRGGSHFAMLNATVNGPVVPLAQNQRGRGIGIYVADLPCPPFNPLIGERGASGYVSGNDVSSQLVGIQVTNSGCVQVVGNRATNNNGAGGNAHGIGIAGGQNNSIYRNTVLQNGLNRTFDSGISVSFAYDNGVLPIDHNMIVANTVTNNCGDGIVVGNSSNNNNSIGNTAKFNGVGNNDFRCDFALPGKFHDLAQFGGTGNLWNTNNICRTQTSNIPAGVCNPTE